MIGPIPYPNPEIVEFVIPHAVPMTAQRRDMMTAVQRFLTLRTGGFQRLAQVGGWRSQAHPTPYYTLEQGTLYRVSGLSDDDIREVAKLIIDAGEDEVWFARQGRAFYFSSQPAHVAADMLRSDSEASDIEGENLSDRDHAAESTRPDDRPRWPLYHGEVNRDHAPTIDPGAPRVVQTTTTDDGCSFCPLDAPREGFVPPEERAWNYLS